MRVSATRRRLLSCPCHPLPRSWCTPPANCCRLRHAVLRDCTSGCRLISRHETASAIPYAQPQDYTLHTLFILNKHPFSPVFHSITELTISSVLSCSISPYQLTLCTPTTLSRRWIMPATARTRHLAVPPAHTVALTGASWDKMEMPKWVLLQYLGSAAVQGLCRSTWILPLRRGPAAAYRFCCCTQVLRCTWVLPLHSGSAAAYGF